MSHEIKTLPSGIIIENRSLETETYSWYIKDTYILHNEGEPAIEHKNGNKYWLQYGKFHHLDGQAIGYGDNKGYRINGQPYSEEEYWKHPAVLAYKYLKEHPELQAFT